MQNIIIELYHFILHKNILTFKVFFLSLNVKRPTKHHNPKPPPPQKNQIDFKEKLVM
jgi:hypothetical protein